jgi:hypothetical protein
VHGLAITNTSDEQENLFFGVICPLVTLHNNKPLAAVSRFHPNPVREMQLPEIYINLLSLLCIKENSELVLLV